MGTNLTAQASTFRSSLQGRTPTEELLVGYLRAIGSEWWKSELKACQEQVGHGVRKTVGAMANGFGGELFVGVKDDRTPCGTTATRQQLEQELAQASAQPGPWYVVNLLQPVASVTEVPLAGSTMMPRAFVLEVVQLSMPALVKDDDASLALYLRSGGSTIRADGYRAMEWSRTTSRARLLLGIFREFEIMVHQIRIAVNYDLRVTSGISPRLPFFVRSLEDGRFYDLLSEGDVKQLLGRRTTSQSGDSQGFLSRFLELEDRFWRVRERQSRTVAPHSVDSMTVQELSNDHRMIEQDVDAFRGWLVQERILPAPRS